MKRIQLILALVCVALLVTASAAIAENAPWWRGQNNTALADWTPQGLTFNAVGNGLEPYVTPSVVVGSNYVSISIPNFYLTNNPQKLMRIQVWWELGGVKPTFDVVNGIYGLPGNETVRPFDLVSETSDPVYSLSDWVIEPNPYWEQISLGKTANTIIDRIIIDTWCVPEPSSIIVLAGGLGTLLAFRRRRV
ncbi:MAG: PEP-CTERM sorting domain-containing protein [Armatimonadota bacterium]